MKRAKRMKILLGILVVVSVMAFAVLHYQEKQENIKNTDEIILQIESDTVSSLSWQYDDTSLSFHKDGSWTYDNDDAFPVDAEKIDSLLSYFSNMEAAFVIENPTDIDQYGLDDPSCSIHLTTDDGEYDIDLGDYSTMDAQRYVSIGDGNVYLVNSDPLSAFEIELSDMIDNDDIPSFEQVESISFSGSQNYDVVYKAYSDDSAETICSDDVYYRKDADTLLPLDTENVEQYLETVSGMSQDTYVTYNVSDEELATYGLDDPELNVSIEYMDSDDEGSSMKTYVLHISRDSATKAEDDGEENNNDEDKMTAYARVGDSKIIYEISETSYDALMAASYNDLRHKNLFSGDFSDVTQLEAEIDGKTYSIDIETDGDEKKYTYNGNDIEITSIQGAIEDLSASSFTEEEPTQEEELSLTVHLDKSSIPSIELVFYRYDGENCLAVVDGTPTALVARDSVVNLIEAINAVVL